MASPSTSSHAPRGRQDIPSHGDAPRKQAGRPQGPPATLVNLRIPVELLARLDRYLDQLETHTGRQANRGVIAR